MSNIRDNLEAIHPSDAAKAIAIAMTVGNVTSVDHALAIYNAFLMQPEGAGFVEFVDSLVAKREGAPEYLLDKPWRASELLPHYSTDWAQGGPIIERERIHTMCPETGDFWDARKAGLTNALEKRYFRGPTMLSAAMRCYVASKLGDEVEVPDELL